MRTALLLTAMLCGCASAGHEAAEPDAGCDPRETLPATWEDFDGEGGAPAVVRREVCCLDGATWRVCSRECADAPACSGSTSCATPRLGQPCEGGRCGVDSAGAVRCIP